MRKLLFVAAAVLVPLSGKAGEVIPGRAEVVDGDTLAIQGRKERVRLYGVDAPESGRTCDDASGRRYLCGSRAASYLAQLLGRNGEVKCLEVDLDRYGRIVAECSTAKGGTVLNAAMVKAGWAVEYAQYSDGRYAAAEADAKAAGRGLWTGPFVLPSQWRRGERLPDETSIDTETQTGSIRPAPTEDAREGCRIKGNIGASGKIYHRPGQRDYARTQVDPTKGERWFCSDGEAQTAGWRAARR